MPILPLDHTEPFAATLGVMHYPAVDETDPPKAKAFTAQFLAAAFKRFRNKGGILPCDVTDLLIDASQPLTDFKERQWGGEACARDNILTRLAGSVLAALQLSRPARCS